MKKIITGKDFPKWFNLTNYDKFSELGIAEIEEQLNIRRWMHFNHHMNRRSCMREPLDKNEDFIQIMEGKPLLSAEDAQNMTGLTTTKSDKVAESDNESEPNKSIEDHQNEYMKASEEYHDFMMSGQSMLVEPTTISGIRSMFEEIKSLSDRANNGDGTSSLGPFFSELPISSVLQKHKYANPRSHFQKDLVLTLDLFKQTDKEILERIATNLQGWRKTIDAPEPLRFKARTDDVDKINTYRAFAIMDILMWTSAFETDIRTSVFMTKVFPDGEYGSKEYSDYIRKFLSKIIHIRYKLVCK
jgi:hypothetical protein